MIRVKRGGEISREEKIGVNKNSDEVLPSRVLRSKKRKLDEPAHNDCIMRSEKRICTSDPLSDSSDCIIVEEIISKTVPNPINNVLTSTPVEKSLKKPKFDESHIRIDKNVNCNNDSSDVIIISDKSKSRLPSVILTENDSSDDDIQIIASTSQKENNIFGPSQKPLWDRLRRITEGLKNRKNSRRNSHKPSKRRKKKSSPHNALHNNNALLRGGSSNFQNSIGRNIFVESSTTIPKTGLRPVIIDGSNVAFYHSNNRFFSCKGLQICIKYFKIRGHEVIAFVPQYRLKMDKTDNPRLLDQLVRDGDVVLTPSRIVDGQSVVSYDDRFIVQTAAVKGGVIVTRDNYRDLLEENPAWAETINYRLLQFTWVKDILIFPNDPLGARGPSLEEFLKFN